MHSKAITKNENGSLLLEALLAIAVSGIVVILVSQTVFSSLKINKTNNEMEMANNLAEELLSSVESVGFEKWQNLYDLSKGSNDQYHAKKNNGSWQVDQGEEEVALNEMSFKRYFTVRDACRNDATGLLIPESSPCPAGSSVDPSVQKITVSLAWENGNLNRSKHIFRWRNKICEQSSWSTASSATTTCPSDFYGSATGIDFSTEGSLKLEMN